jgi:inner membrane protein
MTHAHNLFTRYLCLVRGQGLLSGADALRFWVLTATCAMLPDIDAIGFAFGVRYGSILGHRGLTHSIAFALLVGGIVGTLVVGRRALEIGRLQLVLYFTLVTLSHPVLDAMTNGGLGVALFAPFSSARYFFPWRPIEVSPIGLDFFSESGLAVLGSEVVWVWLPAFFVYGAVKIYRHLGEPRTSG